ncbi:uncharacterized protein LOC103502637 isoform X2 [Cucumis melo]|uniref:Uncharacterized protein LOC103502637 isoform X2 n=1 Tax=Cucumis melo TaxID=3656 RepID=A0A1S3CN04_CUCME|nr:uncharacterized protein LOC103502637 isoform X2 [Cucumis melo]
MLSLNSISQFLVRFLCRCFRSSILHLPSSSLEAKKRRSRGSASAMITRSNLVEQLREYQIRSKHEWASVSFFSSTSNITSSRFKRMSCQCIKMEVGSARLCMIGWM